MRCMPRTAIRCLSRGIWRFKVWVYHRELNYTMTRYAAIYGTRMNIHKNRLWAIFKTKRPGDSEWDSRHYEHRAYTVIWQVRGGIRIYTIIGVFQLDTTYCLPIWTILDDYLVAAVESHACAIVLSRPLMVTTV